VAPNRLWSLSDLNQFWDVFHVLDDGTRLFSSPEDPKVTLLHNAVLSSSTHRISMPDSDQSTTECFFLSMRLMTKTSWWHMPTCTRNT
jgi:hypothetical protein